MTEREALLDNALLALTQKIGRGVSRDNLIQNVEEIREQLRKATT